MRVAAALALISSAALAAPINGDTLTFDGLQIGEEVLNYYDAGFGSLGSGPGPAFGVEFTSGLVVDSTAIAFGPSANVAGQTTMNLADPWTGGLSFYFVGDGLLSFYSSRDAGGRLVASYTLTSQPFFPFGETPGAFQSAVFRGDLALDSVAFGGLVIPEPATWVLTVCGILAIALQRRLLGLRKRVQ